MDFDYKGFLEGLHIEKGDCLDIASDLLSIGAYCLDHDLTFQPEKLIEELKKQVGEEGTIMFRTFNWDFCHGKKFDIKKTPGQTGSLGNIARRMKGFSRTKHPIYSWAVWGRYRDELCALDNHAAFGKESVFDFLYQHGARQIILGNTVNLSLTCLHHCEKIAEVPYRSEKIFEALYVDEYGNERVDKYSMFVRPLNCDVWITSDEQMKEYFGKNNISRETCYDGEIKCYNFKLKEMQDFVLNDLVNNYGKLFLIINGKKGFENPGIEWNELKFN